MSRAPDEERVVHMEGGWPAEIARLKARLRAVEGELAQADQRVAIAQNQRDSWMAEANKHSQRRADAERRAVALEAALRECQFSANNVQWGIIDRALTTPPPRDG